MSSEGVGIVLVLGKQCERSIGLSYSCTQITFQVQQPWRGHTSLKSPQLCGVATALVQCSTFLDLLGLVSLLHAALMLLQELLSHMWIIAGGRKLTVFQEVVSSCG